MKKLLFITTFFLLSIATFSQSEKYFKTMEEKIAAIDSMRNPQALRELSNTFERIAEAEKTQWLPFYYAALTQVNTGLSMMNGMNGGMTKELDPIADKAELLLNKAAVINTNAEIWIVRKMIATLRIMADPMNRFMKYGPEAQEAIEAAMKMDPNNPRIYVLQGQDKYFTPEQFGGSKTEAKRLFEAALEKFESFKPESAISPNWGKPMTAYFLSQINQ